MKKYGFIWKLKFWRKKGFYPSESDIRFLRWLDSHPSMENKKGDG